MSFVFDVKCLESAWDLEVGNGNHPLIPLKIITYSFVIVLYRNIISFISFGVGEIS